MPVPWLPEFYALPGHAKIRYAPSFAAHAVYGIDASSGAAVAALDPRPGDAVIDLCCAPGAKLAMIADRMQRQGSLTGVDVSQV